MQAVTASLLVVLAMSTVFQVVVLQALIKRRATDTLFTAGNTADVQGTVAMSYNVTLGLAIAVAVVALVLAYITYTRAPVWAFWVNLALLVLGLVQSGQYVVALFRGGADQPSMTSLVLGVFELVLLAWYLVALRRFGPWARPRALRAA